MRALATALLALLLATPLPAQPLAPTPPPTVLAPAAEPLSMQEQPDIGADFLLSAVLPGAAQYRAGDGRWVPYVAVEVWGWISYVRQRRNGERLAQRYRDVAWQVARRVSAGPRRDTVFEYYEIMAKEFFPASGAFDADPDDEGIQPEQTPGTYNAFVWRLALDLYSGGRPLQPGSPQYEAALQYYGRRAIPDGFAWAWGVSRLEQQAYVRLIDESDAAYRNAKQYLGLILVNHIASTVDALVTARLRQLGAGSLRLETAPGQDAGGALRLESTLRITF